MSKDIDILKRALQREKAARKSAEKILEAKSLELFQTSQKLEKLLEEKSSQLQGVFENIIDAYVIIDMNGNILKFNDAATKLFGFDINGEKVNVLDLIYKEDFQYAMNSFQSLHNKGFFKNYEARIYTKSKEIKWVHINASIILDTNKKAIAAQGIVRDITQFKNLEYQKKNLLTELEESNIMLQEYAHIVSHDLKSPLRNLDALINWIKEDNKGKLDEKSLQNFNLIELTLERMDKLITDILDYSSVSANSIELKEVKLNKLVNEVINILPKSDQIQITLKKPLPAVKGHYTKLQQLFMNLIGNAIKFSDKEVGKIEIDVKKKDEMYQFSIADNGLGIEKKFHEKIFNIFHSLHKSKSSTGIGLSIVKKIVEKHNGNIWVESELNKGSTFYFTLLAANEVVDECKTENTNNRMPT